MIRKIATVAGPPLLSILLALLITTVFLSGSGYSAASAYQVMWNYGVEPASLIATVNKAIPLYIAGLAAAFALRLGLFNIGIDGQYRMAALFGAVVAAAVPGPLWVRLPLSLLAACVVGALWALVPALLKVYRGVNEVITSILMNSIATTVVAILLADVFREGGGQNTGTAIIDAGGLMPDLPDLGLGTREQISGFLVVAIVLGILSYIILDRSVLGFSMRVTDLSADAAASAGIDVRRMIIVSMLISGGVAGLIGMPHVLSVADRFDGTLPLDLMFTGLAAALLGRMNVIGMAIGSLVLAFVERASQVLGLVQLPTEVGQLFIAVVLISSAVAYWMVEYADERVRLWQTIRRRMHRGQEVAAS